MKEQDLRLALREMYDDVPERTHQIFMDAVSRQRRKAGIPMKRKIVFTPVFAILLALLLGTAAFAAASQVLDWYYANRFTDYPAQDREEVLQNVQLKPQQQQDGNENFSACLEEYAWVVEKKLLILTLRVEPINDAIELHPMTNLDTDGAYVGGNLPPTQSDGEDRSEHWLWSAKGFGTVPDMMDNQANTLYLVDVAAPRLGSRSSAGPALPSSSTDMYRQPDGSVQFVLEYDLNCLDEDEDVSCAIHLTPEQAAETIASRYSLRQIILESGGQLDINIPYDTVMYTEDDEVLYHSGHEPHWVDATLDLGVLPEDFFK